MTRKTKQSNNYMVVKSNEIIQKTRHALSEQQLKILATMVSEIRENDKPEQLYTFSIPQFCKDNNLTTNEEASGVYYKSIKEDIDYIDNQKMYLEDEKNPKIKKRLRWLSILHINEGSGIITFSFHPDMHQYIFNQRKEFTEYSVAYYLELRGRYTLKLYELLKSWENMNRFPYVSVERLKFLLDAEQYRYTDFKRLILEPAIAKINEQTDIAVKWEVSKMDGRAVAEIKFEIYGKNAPLPF